MRHASEANSRTFQIVGLAETDIDGIICAQEVIIILNDPTYIVIKAIILKNDDILTSLNFSPSSCV
jgi:hypothetical protein